MKSKATSTLILNENITPNSPALEPEFLTPVCTLQQTNVPILKPSIQEFEDFETFFNKIENDCKAYGVCKVIPPDSWVPQFQLNFLEVGSNVYILCP
jgi:hypothetical protein